MFDGARGPCHGAPDHLSANVFATKSLICQAPLSRRQKIHFAEEIFACPEPFNSTSSTCANGSLEHYWIQLKRVLGSH